MFPRFSTGNYAPIVFALPPSKSGKKLVVWNLVKKLITNIQVFQQKLGVE